MLVFVATSFHSKYEMSMATVVRDEDDRRVHCVPLCQAMMIFNPTIGEEAEKFALCMLSS